MKTAHSWFRFYNTTMDNEKVLKLTDAQYRAWTILLCIASKKGGVIPEDGLSLSILLRKPPAKCRDIIQVLISAGLIDHCQNGYIPHDWSERQYESDVSTARVKAFRERNGNGQRNVSVTANETPPETDTESDTETEKKVEAAPAKAVAPKPTQHRGTRWPADQEVPEEWIEYVLAHFRELGRAPPDLRLEAKKFASYWASKSGANATKIDWKKTFLTWCLNARPEQRSFAEQRFNNLKSGASRAAFVDGQRGEGVESPADNLVRLALPAGGR